MSELEMQILDDASKALKWALGEIEMQENRLIQMGDPEHLVKSETQKKGVTWATNVMIRCQVASGASSH